MTIEKNAINCGQSGDGTSGARASQTTINNCKCVMLQGGEMAAGESDMAVIWPKWLVIGRQMGGAWGRTWPLSGNYLLRRKSDYRLMQKPRKNKRLPLFFR